MSIDVVLILLLALLAANLPFLSERWFLIWKRASKPFVIRLIELVVFYFVIGLLARAVEGRLGAVHRQDWQFYAVTGALFLVFAYPGFVFRYLWRKRAL